MKDSVQYVLSADSNEIIIRHAPYKIGHDIIQPKIKFETPIGAIESDSGNHIIDGVTVVAIILVLYIGKKLVDRFFKA